MKLRLALLMLLASITSLRAMEGRGIGPHKLVEKMTEEEREEFGKRWLSLPFPVALNIVLQESDVEKRIAKAKGLQASLKEMFTRKEEGTPPIFLESEYTTALKQLESVIQDAQFQQFVETPIEGSPTKFSDEGIVTATGKYNFYIPEIVFVVKNLMDKNILLGVADTIVEPEKISLKDEIKEYDIQPQGTAHWFYLLEEVRDSKSGSYFVMDSLKLILSGERLNFRLIYGIKVDSLGGIQGFLRVSQGGNSWGIRGTTLASWEGSIAQDDLKRFIITITVNKDGTKSYRITEIKSTKVSNNNNH